ncbi:GDSL Lipase/Acylhydrolase family protein [Halenospora varia]|nr:GDSL Lipase/Acylhydrolase family protein [Halenospora varia]
MRPYDQIFLFGDSITELSISQEYGFSSHAALQNAFIRRLDVVNRGCGGYTTAHAIKMLPELFPSPPNGRIRLLILFFGANDSCLPHTFQHVPIPTFVSNLKSIISFPALQAHKPRVILVTPPPVEEHTRNPFDVSLGFEPMRTAETTAAYAAAAKKTAKELGVSCVDMWGRMIAEAGWDEGEVLCGSLRREKSEVLAGFMYDGLHFGGEAYKILFEEIMKVIEEDMPELMPEQIPMVYPFCLEAPM